MLQDPYLGNYKETRGWTTEPTMMPDIMFGDLYMFVISRPSEFTGESLKAYKSLDGYKFYLAGHVQEIEFKKLKGPYIALRTEVSTRFWPSWPS